MIAKRIDMRDASKSRATRLAKYLADELERAGRVADVFTTNCISDNALIAAKEIEICQAKNTRAKDDKTYHLLLSFPDGERPDQEQLREMADAAAKALGYGEHQRIAVVHDDTDNLHMHLIINKIHPKRLTIHTPCRDFKTLAKLCTKLERDFSLLRTNHEPTKSTTENKARDMEAHSGTESFLSYARKKATPILSAAQSWEALHQGLSEVGIALRLKGNGLVMVDHTGTIVVKASAVARAFSKGNLEKRFGAFASHESLQMPSQTVAQPIDKPHSTYQKLPTSGTSKLYQQYLQEKESVKKAQKEQLTAIWEQQRHLMHQVAATAKLSLPKAASPHLKRKLRRQARATANAAITNIRRSLAKRREEVKRRHKTLGYLEWLKQEAERGNIPAIYALRKRGAVAPALVNITSRDLLSTKLIAAKITHITGRGTLFYRVGTDVFRDTGEHLSLKRDVSDAGIQAALRIAKAKFAGQPLDISGTQALKQRCIDIAVEKRLDVIFANSDMEKERLARMQSSCIKMEKREESVKLHKGIER